MKVQYFFIKDKIRQREVALKCFPTNEIWSNILVKPFQGAKFWQMRAKLMTCSMTYEETSLLDCTKLMEHGTSPHVHLPLQRWDKWQ